MTRSIVAALVTVACAAHAEPLARCVDAKAAQADFSGVVVVLHRGAAVVSLARGVLGAPAGAAITTATRFNIASAGKMFTAVAIAQLVDAGKLRFGDPVGQHVAGLPPELAAVTIHQLLTHTAGLGDFFAPENLPILRRARTASELLPLIVAQKPQPASGSPFRYSNSGFALLGVVIERVSGQTYGEYLRTHVFAPAGMTSTSLDPEPLDTLAPALTAKTRDGGVGPLHPAPGALIYGSPAGGAFSSALDLHKFATALREHRLASAAATTALTSQEVSTPTGRQYGYGFGIEARDGRVWLGHNGGTLGANAEVAFTADGEWAIVVLANRDPPAATAMREYLEALLADPTKVDACSRSAAGH